MIHMLTIDRAISIVFLDNDLPFRGPNHTHPLYISVGCLGHKVPFILLDNGSTLNVCPLATTITLGFKLFYFETSTHTITTRNRIFGDGRRPSPNLINP